MDLISPQHCAAVLKKATAVFLLLVASISVQAASSDDLASFKKSFAAKWAKINPQFRVDTVADSDLPGFYQVQIVNGPLLYATKDGQYFFTGTLYQFKGEEMVNLTDQAAAMQRKQLMAQLKPSEMIVFSPAAPVKTKRVITVFTDVDCGYCLKLHKEVPELNARGIEVRYMAYPRAGVGSKSYDKIVSAWCAENQQDALTALKNRQTIPTKTCDNPVAEQFQMGRQMGVTGTPAIVLQDGTLIPGYKPAPALAKSLGL